MLRRALLLAHARRAWLSKSQVVQRGCGTVVRNNNSHTPRVPQCPDGHATYLGARVALRGSESIQARALPNTLDAISSAEFGEEGVERVAAANLPTFSAQQPEPLAVVHGVAIATKPENVDGDLPQPPPSQLAIQTLKTHLRPPIRELLDLTQEPLVGGELFFKLLDDRPMCLHAALEFRAPLDQ